MFVKESEFANRFFELLGQYIEGIERQHGHVCRMIAAGCAEDVVRAIRSGRFAAEQSRLLMEGFDRIFLEMYPCFVDDVNTLLAAERRFGRQPHATLSTELRILALEHLGIDDCQRVGRLLGISVNTVYAYRARSRSRALNRHTFGSDLLALAPGRSEGGVGDASDCEGQSSSK